MPVLKRGWGHVMGVGDLLRATRRTSEQTEAMAEHTPAGVDGSGPDPSGQAGAHPSARATRIVGEFFGRADIRLNGARPWDIAVRSDEFCRRVVRDASLGFAESYVDGEWDCERIDELVARALRGGLFDGPRPQNWRRRLGLAALQIGLSSPNGLRTPRDHYNLGNNLFEAMLDRRMVYSCGYWRDATTLDAAQDAKLDLICRKLGLTPGMCVLDIGGGWGGFAAFAAERYGATVLNITVSEEQVRFADERSRGLPVESRVCDYRDIDGVYDRVVSIGMFEHVGAAHYAEFMTIVRDHLAEAGLFLLHTIGRDSRAAGSDPWIKKTIFPHSEIPSLAQIASAIDGVFVMEDLHAIGADYDPTLMAWYQNFEHAWPSLRDMYGDRFFRMWRYYLLSCAGAFRARNVEVWQILLSRNGIVGGVPRVR
jgi:cyclopropane-fatty-acyl-phospholipid synthase